MTLAKIMDEYKRGHSSLDIIRYLMHLLPFQFTRLIAQTRCDLKGLHYYEMEGVTARGQKDDALKYMAQNTDPLIISNQ